ncbi:MAG TPA: ABC transporter substrate-binding protein [Actinomycetota bacterium]|nr:ABC transporter substrate-binding protein [Actinomycetota bacterium]
MAAVTATTLLAGLFVPGAGAQTPAEEERIVFTLGDDNDLDSMNPWVGVEAPAYLMYALNYDLLVNFDLEDLSPAPGLAESWEVSEDGLTWTFDIREGVTWHDGEPFSAHDVAYTYNRILEERQGCCIDYIRQAETVEAVDDTTLVIQARRPTVQFLTAYVYILPEHIWSELDEEEVKTFENYPNPVGTGAFQVVEWVEGQFFRMEANPDYWGGAAIVDEVVYRIFQNEDALAQALLAGEIDFADTLGAGIFDSLVGQENIGTNEASIPSFEEIGFNVGADETYDDSDGHPALKDVVVRRAIAHAIDKETIIDRVLLGHGTIGSTIVPPVTDFYHYEPTPEETIPFDIDEANRLLDDAGYEDTDDDGVREMPGGGEPLHFRYFVRNEENSTVTTSEFVADWLGQIGISTDVRGLSDTRLTNVIYDGNYDMFHWGWFPDADPDFILSVMTCGQRPPDGVWSDSFYCNDQYDDMYEEQQTTLDLDERAAVIKEMQRIVYEDSPYVVLFYDRNLQAYREDRWTGFIQQPAGTGDLLAAYGPYSFMSVRPKAADEGGTGETGTTSSSGIPTAVWLGGIGLLLAAIVVWLLLRRRGGVEERE